MLSDSSGTLCFLEAIAIALVTRQGYTMSDS